MALVPAANGIDSLVADEGINVGDLGGGAFAVGLNVRILTSIVTGVIDDPWLNGYNTFDFGAPFATGFAGAMMVNVLAVSGLNPGQVIAGPDDRINVTIKKVADNVTVFSVPIKIYNRSGVDLVFQKFGGSSMFETTGEEALQAYLEIYNNSDNMECRGFQCILRLYPLSCLPPNAAAVVANTPY